MKMFLTHHSTNTPPPMLISVVMLTSKVLGVVVRQGAGCPRQQL